MPSTYVNGQRLYYEKMGHGTPLLLMHGRAQVGQDLIWLATALATDYQVYLLDMPGYGRSIPPYRTYPDDFYNRDAALVDGLLDALKLPPVHVMGYSDGGEVALLLATTRPCRSVIAWGAVGKFDESLCEQVQKSPLESAETLQAIQIKHPGQDVAKWLPEWRKAFCAMIAAGGDVSLHNAHLIRCPLMLMLGENDELNPVDDGRRFVDAACMTKQCVFQVFQDVGHGIHKEQPDMFLAIVQNFLRQA
jgi:valacyclovir hydrolase